jgi:hypothetical protein
MGKTSLQSKVNGVVFSLQQPAWYWSLSLLLAGFYVGTSLYISFHRPLWYDEIFTAFTSRMPNVRTIWQSLSETVQQLPPLYFLITRIFDQMFRHADIGIRVPSALALGTGLLITFDIARRLTDGLYGLIAMSFLTTSFVTNYGYEARPYALYFMLAAIALWLWVFTKDDSKTAAVAFGVVFLIGVAIHYYFLLCLAPFGILALAERRICHPKVIAAAAGVMCSLAVLYPQIASSYTAAHAIKGSLALPSIPRLQEVYLQLFPVAIIPLVLIATGGIAFSRSRERLVTAMNPGERVSWLFLAVPLAGYILAHLVTKVLISRYIIGAVPGIAVAVTCLFWRHCRESGRLSLALLVLFGGFGISQQLRTMIRIPQNLEKGTRRMLAVEDTLQREGKRYFAVCSGILFVEAWHYSKRPDLYAYVRTPGQPSFTNKYVAQNTISIEEIVAKARQTAVIAAEPAFLETLDRAGLHLKVRFADPLYVVYLE